MARNPKAAEKRRLEGEKSVEAWAEIAKRRLAEHAVETGAMDGKGASSVEPSRVIDVDVL